MKNKIELKKCLRRIGLLSIMVLGLFCMVQFREYQSYTENFNQKLGMILLKVRETYPEVSEAEIIQILNQSDTTDEGEEFWKKYGISLEKDALLVENDRKFRVFGGLQAAVLIFGVTLVVLMFLKYNRKKDRELLKITRYVEEINRKNYHLQIEDMSEDELSILKNEIYKTTVMLKETAENSVRDKEHLKQSLSDISHQLKTPLTSISVSLDNLIDDPQMDEEIRKRFLRSIRREISNINFLVQSLLKLSKLDSNTVGFMREEISVKKLLEETMENVSSLCDLKNVQIQVSGKTDGCIFADFRWQVEALTNILKNSVEYSPKNGRIRIQVEENHIYTAISVRDFGPGMDEEDQKHVFERFYRGKKAAEGSIGIGLALAKAIIEEDRGHVSVQSDETGSTFTVKYFK